jgi:hypothetical protein
MAVVLWILTRTVPEMTRHVIAAIGNQPPVFIGTSSIEHPNEARCRKKAETKDRA